MHDNEANLENTTDKLINYLNQSLVLIFSELRPQKLHRKSKELKNIKNLRKKWNDIYSLIVKHDIETNKYVFRKSFKFYSKNLSEYGMKYIFMCYKRLYDDLLNKVYSITPTDEQKPEEDDLKLSLERLGFGNITLIEINTILEKKIFIEIILEKTLEYHMDTPNVMKEPEKYKILEREFVKHSLH